MWWQDLFLGFWNGFTAWIVFIVHLFGGWPEFPFYDFAHGGNWYDFGFLVGAGSPLLGFMGAGSRSSRVRQQKQPGENSNVTMPY
ncbi:MAG: hypothetical protein J0I20_25430 [Chloroflexi bacterium]|nr:hypothetical protein [Chloroflexota bacterium]OJW01877.1 MAG: hypothetical protein BGO39_28430 [Chloroflexi bacterium 54-19]